MGILRTNEISGLETPTAVTGSVVFDGTGDYLSLAASGDFSYETGDFTIETWIYPTSLNSVNTIVANWDLTYTDNEWGIILNSSNQIQFQTALTNIITSSINVSLNRWFHIAVSRSSGTIRIFVNGVLGGSSSTSYNFNEINSLGIGGYPDGSSPFTGYISNLRILKGTALYASDFTPPVHELQPIGDTVLLCCNNPDSAGAEATGKTITVNGDAAASTVSPGLTRDFTSGTQFEGVAKFDTQGYFVPPSGTTEQQFPNFAAIENARGIVSGGGAYPTPVNTIDFITISTAGNASDFGDLTQARQGAAMVSSSTRGAAAGGGTFGTPIFNIIDYITISSTGNAFDFGDLTIARRDTATVSSSTRGIIAGGYNDAPIALHYDTLDYVTIASLGNATTFGSLIGSTRDILRGLCNSPTRGIFGGGFTPTIINIIQYITISTTGNALDFGDLTISRAAGSACSSSVRGLFGGGATPSDVNIIDYITITTLGNAIDFGDLIQTRNSLSACSSSTLGVFVGGYITPAAVNTIDYVTIAATGNASDFGDLTQARGYTGACSNGHGGLG